MDDRARCSSTGAAVCHFEWKARPNTTHFLDAKEKYRSKRLIRLALEKPNLMALRALMELGAALWPVDVKFAEGLPNPFRRLALQEIVNYEMTYE
jgi:hypothetical protein